MNKVESFLAMGEPGFEAWWHYEKGSGDIVPP